MIDIKEYDIPEEVLSVLLKDYTTGKNIVWGTDQYGFAPDSEIKIEQIISGDLIKPRVLKTQEEQKARTNSKAEVFTPIEIIKKMNDMVDKDFKGSDIDYINRKVLEVTCGEGPYLVSRYDVSTGEMIKLGKREGLLDRKMRKVNRISEEKSDWFLNACKAVESVYGYEWQGDSLLLARENILYTVLDWYGYPMDPIDMVAIARRISSNVIQMDGITMCVPYTDIPAKIKNWETKEFERFDNKKDEISLF